MSTVEQKPAQPELSEAVERLRRRFHDEADVLRPVLHRFCSRMLGSVTDGEDAVQETLAIAFYRLPDLASEDSLKPWLFRIAHNKCLDLLRFRRRFPVAPDAPDATEDLTVTTESQAAEADQETQELAQRALASIVVQLPPRERASIVLKDVLDYTLEEAAEITDTSVGAVKAALHRGRSRLRELTELPPRRFLPDERALVDQWVLCFNRRDWDGVRALLSDDARLEVVGQVSGPFGDRYLTNYGKLPVNWKLAVASVDGEDAIVQFRQSDGAWKAHAVVRLDMEGGRVRVVRDYVHVEYLLADATVKAANS